MYQKPHTHKEATLHTSDTSHTSYTSYTHTFPAHLQDGYLRLQEFVVVALGQLHFGNTLDSHWVTLQGEGRRGREGRSSERRGLKSARVTLTVHGGGRVHGGDGAFYATPRHTTPRHTTPHHTTPHFTPHIRHTTTHQAIGAAEDFGERAAAKRVIGAIGVCAASQDALVWRGGAQQGHGDEMMCWKDWSCTKGGVKL
jgi:hypothetical protein